ncbi:MAG: hypothetical protein U0992_14830 [Planctomycetaceae bacterium]
MFEQERRNVHIRESRRFMQRRGTAFVAGIDIRTGVNQQLRDVDSAPECCAVQTGFLNAASHLALITNLDVATGPDQAETMPL